MISIFETIISLSPKVISLFIDKTAPFPFGITIFYHVCLELIAAKHPLGVFVGNLLCRLPIQTAQRLAQSTYHLKVTVTTEPVFTKT